ncbi:MAG: small multi-drug export protein [bacterium]
MFNMHIGLKPILVMVWAMLPVTELRAAIPLAISAYGMSWQSALFWALLGNSIITVIVMFCLDPIARFLSKHFSIFERLFTWLFARTRRKHSKLFETWGAVALIVFVAIPLPGTGAWSGTLAAFVFGIKPKKAIPLIIAGLVFAGIAVTILTVGIRTIIL